MCERAISEEKTDACAQARAHMEVNRDFNGQMCTYYIPSTTLPLPKC